MFDVAIVGGGIGGLATGAMLSKAGFKVLILEKEKGLGGRCSPCYHEDTYIECAPHLIRGGLNSSLAMVLNILNEKVDFIPIDNIKILHEGSWKNLPLKLTQLIRSSVGGIRLRYKLGKFFNLILKEKPDELVNMPVEDYLRRKDLHEIANLVKFYSGLSVYYTELDQLSTGEFIEMTNLILKNEPGLVYPKGGWKKIIDIFKDNILKFDGEIKTGVNVERILVSGIENAGFKIGERIIMARAYVAAMHAQSLRKLLDTPKAYLEKLDVGGMLGLSITYKLKEPIISARELYITQDPFTISMSLSAIDSNSFDENTHVLNVFAVLPSNKYNKDSLEQEIKKVDFFITSAFDIKDRIISRYSKVYDIITTRPTVYQNRETLPPVKTPVTRLFHVSDSVNLGGIGLELTLRSAIKTYHYLREIL
ncbi:MAG: NAD(P)-binding protein [Candidatus Njordarchaeales archaeon]